MQKDSLAEMARLELQNMGKGTHLNFKLKAVYNYFEIQSLVMPIIH